MSGGRHGWWILGGLLLAGVLVPFALVGEALESVIVAEAAQAEAGPRVGLVAALLLAADLLLPIPSSVVATAAGYLLGPAQGGAWVWLGLNLSVALGYLVGRQGEGLALRLVGPDSLMQARSLFSRHGLWVLVLSRPVPVLAEATAVLAGLGAMPPGPLALTAGLSNLGLAALYAWVGSSGRGELGLVALFGGAVLLPGLGLLLSRVVRRGALSA